MKHETSEHTKVETRIEKAKPGTIFFPADYFAIGSAASLHKIFSHMAKDKKVIRLAKCIYFKPEDDPKLGILNPSYEDIAALLAKNEKVIIRASLLKSVVIAVLLSEIF
jgi:hypothetical protein